jgi:hypothetical protein
MTEYERGLRDGKLWILALAGFVVVVLAAYTLGH